MKSTETTKKSRIKPQAIIGLLVLGCFVVLWGGCKLRAEKNGLSAPEQAYADYHNVSLNTMAVTVPSKEINAFAVLKTPINEQQVIEIFDTYGVKPAGLRFESGDGVGGHGFTKGFVSFEEAMPEFWEDEISGASRSYQNALNGYEARKNDPSTSPESLQGSVEFIERMKGNLERAENHEVIFHGVTFLGSATTAKTIRNDHRDLILFIDAQ